MFKRFSASTRRTPAARATRRPELELLEDRIVPAIGSPFGISASGRSESGPAAAVSSNGSRVVVWAQETEAGSGTNNIVAQRFDASGNTVGGQITISSRDDNEFRPDVAIDNFGFFAVTWVLDFNDSGDVDVYYALFSNTGTEFASGSVAASGSDEDNPSVGMAGDGRFVVAYSFGNPGSSDVLAQRYSAVGNPVGTRINVATRFDRNEFGPRVDVASNGKFAVAYNRSDPNNIANTQVFAATYTANGGLTRRTKVATEGSFFTPTLDVGIRDNGDVVVAYTHFFTSSDTDIFSRKVSAAGLLGAVRSVASSISNDLAPRLAMNRFTGEFVVAWEREGSVVVDEFFKNGLSASSENVITEGESIFAPSVAVNSLDSVFVVWAFDFSATDDDIRGAFGTLT